MVTLIPNTMKAVIPPTVQEPGVTGAALAPKSFSFLKKRSGGGARRALAALGPNNSQFNMSMAQSHLAMAQESFSSRWNFNPAKEVPLPSGRYQWAPISDRSHKDVTPAITVEVSALKDTTLLKDITNPTITTSSPSSAVTPEVADLHKTTKDDLENNMTVPSSTIRNENSDSENTPDTENRKQGSSPKNESVLTKNGLSKSQICITEFFKPQKRKSSYHSEGSPPNTPPKKKLRTVH